VAEAAKGKQIIVFTHNLLFYNEVAEAAAQAAPQIPIAKRIITKSATAGFGLIPPFGATGSSPDFKFGVSEVDFISVPLGVAVGATRSL
jgi:hypothetical protein